MWSHLKIWLWTNQVFGYCADTPCTRHTVWVCHMGPFSLNRRCLRLQISGILLWSNVTLQCGDILISRSWGGLRVPSKEKLSSDVLHEWLVLHPRHSEQTHVKGTIHPKMERRYLKDFSNGFWPNNKILVWNDMFWTNYPFNGQVFHIHSFHYVAENQQNLKAIQNKKCVLKYSFFHV